MAKVSRAILKDLVKECLVEILAEGLVSTANTINESKTRRPRKSKKSRDDRIAPEVLQKRNKMLHEKTSRQAARKETISSLTYDPMMQEIFADTAETTLLEQKSGEGHGNNYVPVDGAQKMVADNSLEDLFDGSQNWASLAFSGGKN